MSLTTETILGALRSIEDPDLHKDIVTLGFIKDADVYGPNLPQMLGIDLAPGEIGLTEDQKMIPPIAHGVKALSIGMLVPKDQAVIWRGPMLHSAVQQFMRDVAWGELDYLIVDLPPGTGDVAISLAQSVGVAGAVVV